MPTLFGWTIGRKVPTAATRASGSQIMMLTGDRQLKPIKATAGSPSAAPNLSGPVEIRDDDLGLAMAHQVSVWAYNCTNLRRQKVAGIKHQVVNKATGKPIPDHRLLTVFDNQFRFEQSDLLADWEMALCLHGEAYFEVVRNPFHQVTGLRWLNPIAVEPFMYNGRIAWYDYQDNYAGRFVRFQPNEVIYHKYRNPLDDYRGLPPMRVALESVNTHRDIKRATRAWYKNDSRPDGIVTPKDIPLTDGQYATLVEKIQGQLKGAKNRGRTFVADHPIEWIQVQREPVPEQPELELSQYREIAAAFGVPLSMLGAWDSASYQSAPEQRKSFYEDLIKPECQLIARVVNTLMLPLFDPSGLTRFEFDFTDIDTTLEDTAQKATVVQTRIQGANMTINEGRAAFNQPAIPGGDVLLIPSGYTPVPVEQLPARTELGSVQDQAARIATLNSKLAVGGVSLNEYRAALNLSKLPNGEVFYLPGGGIQVPAEKIGEMQPKPSYQPFGNPQVTPYEAAQLANGEVPVSQNDTANVTPADAATAQVEAGDKPKQATASSELAAWERSALNSGRNKALRFVCYNTPSVLVDHIRVQIAAAKSLDKAAIKDIFARATERLADVPRIEDESGAIKSYEDTRTEFISNLVDLIRGGLNEDVSRRRFGTVMRAQLRRLGQMAYQDGLQSGGVNDPLDEDDLFKVQSWMLGQSEYVSQFANEVFKQGLSEAEIESRAVVWANKALEPIYQEGLLTADKNGMYQWKLGATEQHCKDCERLNGQVHRLKQWYSKGWTPKSDRLECNGFNCDCSFERTKDPARGRF